MLEKHIILLLHRMAIPLLPIQPIEIRFTHYYTLLYHMGGNFRGVLIFVDFLGATQTTKNSLKISDDP